MGNDQHIAGLQPVEQAGEPAPLRGSNVPGDRLRDHAARLDLEAGGCDLLKLVIGGLTGGGHTEVGEGARHGRISPRMAVRNLPSVQNSVKLVSGQVKNSTLHVL